MIRTLYRHPSGTIIADLPRAQLAAALRDVRGRLWVDLVEPTDEESNWVLNELFQFHPLAVEDAIRDSHVPKVDDYSSYLYLVFHTVGMGDERMDLHTYEMDMFLGANYLVTMHTVEHTSIDKMWQADYHQRNGLSRGPAHLLYELLDRQIDGYIPLLDRFEEQMEALGDIVVRKEQPPGSMVLNEILTAKSSALRLHRILVPQRELLYRLSRNDFTVIPAETRIYFRDVYDHLVRFTDLAESMRELAGSTIEIHLAMAGNRMNEVMKVLTVISTIFMPLSFVAGVYGMNFVHMPELDWRFGYALVWLIFIMIVFVMVRMFRRRGWF